MQCLLNSHEVTYFWCCKRICVYWVLYLLKGVLECVSDFSLSFYLSLSPPLSLIKIISFAYNGFFFYRNRRYLWISKCHKNHGSILRMKNDKANPRFLFFLNSWSVTTTFYFISATNIDDNVFKWIYTVTLRNTVFKTCCKWEKLFIKQIHVT